MVKKTFISFKKRSSGDSSAAAQAAQDKINASDNQKDIIFADFITDDAYSTDDGAGALYLKGKKYMQGFGNTYKSYLDNIFNNLAWDGSVSTSLSPNSTVNRYTMASAGTTTMSLSSSLVFNGTSKKVTGNADGNQTKCQFTGDAAAKPIKPTDSTAACCNYSSKTATPITVTDKKSIGVTWTLGSGANLSTTKNVSGATITATKPLNQVGGNKSASFFFYSPVVNFRAADWDTLNAEIQKNPDVVFDKVGTDGAIAIATNPGNKGKFTWKNIKSGEYAYLLIPASDDPGQTVTWSGGNTVSAWDSDSCAGPAWGTFTKRGTITVTKGGWTFKYHVYSTSSALSEIKALNLWIKV